MLIMLIFEDLRCERLGNKSTQQTELQVHLGQNVPLKHEDSTHDRNGKCENDGTVITSSW